jgi:hypothetical protein
MTWPDSVSWRSVSRSCGRCVLTNMVSRWRISGESARARSCRPIPVHCAPSPLAPSPPAMTSVPRGASVRRSRDSGVFSAMSRIRS